MKKAAVLLCLLFICAGCVSNDSTVLTNNLDNVFNNIDSVTKYYTNNKMRYYSYYLPSDMGEEEIDSESVTINYNDSKIVMNLNIADIINEKYYPDELLKDDKFFDSQYQIYENSGSYTLDDEEYRYEYKLYKRNNTYAISLKTVNMNFYGVSTLSDVVELTKHLLMVSKSIEVEKDAVLKTYYKKDVIDYSKKQIDLFDNSLPSNGKLSDMLTDDAIVKDNSNIADNQAEENTNDQENDTSEEQNIEQENTSEEE